MSRMFDLPNRASDAGPIVAAAEEIVLGEMINRAQEALAGAIRHADRPRGGSLDALIGRSLADARMWIDAAEAMLR